MADKIQGDEVNMTTNGAIPDDFLLPNKSLFRIDEVADYFGVTYQCIWLWIQHGHLNAERIKGCIRVSRDSILACRFNPKNSVT